MTEGNTSTPAAFCTISREPGTALYRRERVASTFESMAWRAVLAEACELGVVVVQPVMAMLPSASAAAMPRVCNFKLLSVMVCLSKVIEALVPMVNKVPRVQVPQSHSYALGQR
jgi:hypothetical protein